uniref:Uncharacterized protein n=1 Tax=Anopheles epiroticus TaxID=199890 RepID=A0A182PYU3_9DIPT
MLARCTKCGGEHLAKQCFKELGNIRICANCEGNHSPFNRNCKARRDFIEKRDAKTRPPAADRYIPAPIPETSAWNNRLNWGPPPPAPTVLPAPAAQAASAAHAAHAAPAAPQQLPEQAPQPQPQPQQLPQT